MKVLFIGDICGSPGRKAVAQLLPKLKEMYRVDFTIANAENAAGGFGITPNVADELFGMGIDLLTSGNHVWDRKEIVEYIAKNGNLLRPVNYPAEVPGRGTAVMKTTNGERIAVINVIGRIFMSPADCPFGALDREIAKVSEETKIIIVDLHAEATSEKVALGWYLDGRASAALGTHTHVQTADERVLPGGTAYITDLGMTGPRDSVIGVDKDQAIARFLTLMPTRFDVAPGPVQLCGALVEIDSESGRAKKILRLQINL